MDLSDIPILLVEDEPTTRLFTVKILRRLGFTTVHEAEDGQEAFDALQTLKVAFVICDLHMQPMDGLTFMTKLRQSDDPILKGLPVIMLTSEMRIEAIEVSKQLGAVDYVVKPTSRIELKAAIEKALGILLDPT